MADDFDERHFQEAEVAVTRAVEAFAGEIESMFAKWETVPPSYIMEHALLELATVLSELTDDLKTVAGPATAKLLDALVAYRDSQPEDR